MSDSFKDYFPFDQFPEDLSTWKCVLEEYEKLENQNKEMRKVLEFYAQISVWGTDVPGNKTAIDPCDQEIVETKFSVWGRRGGKRARDVLKKLFQDHCDRMDF